MRACPSALACTRCACPSVLNTTVTDSGCAPAATEAQALSSLSARTTARRPTQRATRPRHGWRYELFGRDAERLKRGELALAPVGENLKLIEI